MKNYMEVSQGRRSSSRSQLSKIKLPIAIFSTLMIWSSSVLATSLFLDGSNLAGNDPIHSGYISNLPDQIALMTQKVHQLIQNQDYMSQFLSVNNSEDTKFTAYKAVADKFTTTLKYNQYYKGIQLIGDQALFHFRKNGSFVSTTGQARNMNLNVIPTLSKNTVMKIITDHYQTPMDLTEPLELRIYRDLNDVAHLVYTAKTQTNFKQTGLYLMVDAHTGQIVFETDRHCSLFSQTVFGANTEDALKHTDSQGYPTNINTAWYKVIIKDKLPATAPDRSAIDDSALNAFRNTKAVYNYYLTRYERKSYDDADAAINSVVHMGKQMNNAFWTSEYKIIAYGDGDGKMLTDLSVAKDVAGHELTHAVTSSEADLLYSAESGALNEHYSDFFGKMIDWNPGNWYVGDKVMGPDMIAKGRKAIRNMINPEEFKHPGSMDSTYRVPTSGYCGSQNDRCGVHINSGIPNHASAMIVDKIGKEKAEHIYYNVLTQRLTANSNFSAQRKETIAACSEIFGASSAECQAVVAAFDTVKIN